MQDRYVIGNWKMNGCKGDLVKLAQMSHLARKSRLPDVTVVVCPPATMLWSAAGMVGIHLGAQDASEHEAGPHTGEISAAILADLGVTYCIVGHSERRESVGETSEVVSRKADALINAGIRPVICVGEPLEQRRLGSAVDYVSAMAEASLPTESGACLLAYEPVWAIGSGETATCDQIGEIHEVLHQLAGPNVPLLYGGSVNADNAASLSQIDNVHGFLVGNASLDPYRFLGVAEAYRSSAVPRHEEGGATGAR